jgi:ATP-dependent RNA helicase DHX57
MFVTDCTTTQPYPLLLFGDIDVLHDQQVIVIDKWIKFSAPARIAVIMKEIRNQLNILLEEKIKQPTLDIANHILTDVVTELISTDGL